MVSAAEGHAMTGPVRSRAAWIAGGLALQALGVGGVAAFAWIKVRHQNIGGHVTAATVRLVWAGAVHTRQGLMVLVAGALLYAAGSILMARPFVSRAVTLFVAVPIAAVAGMLVLGVLAFLLALLIAAVSSDLDVPGLDFGDGGGRRRRRQSPAK
jgi:hypothetical protein